MLARANHTIAGWLLLALALGSGTPAPAQTPPAPEPENPRAAELHAKLARGLAQAAAEFDGVMGIFVKDLTTGESLQVNADLIFPQASSIKIPILIELYRQAQVGRLRLEDRIEVQRAEMVGGSGVLQDFGDGTSAVSLRDLAALMVVLSDNSATNLLIDRVGIANVNATLDRLGLTHTRLQRRMMDREAQRADRENLSTPGEMAALLEKLYRGELLDAAHTAAVMEILKYYKETPLRRGVPDGIAVADKPGSIGGVRCDSGIVLLPGRPYVLSVMTTYDADGDAAERAITGIARLVYSYFDRLAHSNSHGAQVP